MLIYIKHKKNETSDMDLLLDELVRYVDLKKSDL